MASKSTPPIQSASNIDIVAPSPGQEHRCHRFVGIEISPERAWEALANVDHAKSKGVILSHVSVEVRVEKALEADYSRATVVFLYFVPRELRMIRPLLWKVSRGEDGGGEGTGGDSDGAAALESNPSQPRQTHRIQLRGLLQSERLKRIIAYMNPIEYEPNRTVPLNCLVNNNLNSLAFAR